MTREPSRKKGFRLPDFIIIGAMKSGTTSLYRWLEEQPELRLPSTKEPNFFSRESQWKRGVDWYGGLFKSIPTDRITGEASASYTALATCTRSAERMASLIPSVRLVYVLRHPVGRLWSHYQHEVLRGRETRAPVDALADPENPYVQQSLYAKCLSPYIERFSREQICVVRFEDLTQETSAWLAVLAHLGLSHRPKPHSTYNATAEKQQFRRATRLLWEMGTLSRFRNLPGPLRRLAKKLLLRPSPLATTPSMPVEKMLPEITTELIWDDVKRLERWLGVEEPMWTKESQGLVDDIDVCDLAKASRLRDHSQSPDTGDAIN
jgi:hypothetical protein